MIKRVFPLAAVAMIVLCLSGSACQPAANSRQVSLEYGPLYPIKPYAQQRGGDPEKGFEYLVYGDHVGNGVPLPVFERLFKLKEDTVLRREGINGQLLYTSNAFSLKDSLMTVVSGNCFTCHAGTLEGQVVLGMGSSSPEFQRDNGSAIHVLNWLVKRKYGKDSPEWAAYAEQAAWLKAVAPAIVMNNPGSNPAFRLEEAAIRFRRPEDLSYQPEANYPLPSYPIGTDVPPLWNVDKKQALYYNGMGRGDFTKLLMQVSLLGIPDSSAAREVQRQFVDVLAWLESLEPPRYPRPIDQGLAQAGQLVFEQRCSSCHGTYGEGGHFPNKLIPVHKVGTDPYYARYALESDLPDWYNRSWFNTEPYPAMVKPSYAYMAQPLDGVWATAPYLHNGSVPTLAALLDSRLRPDFWWRPYRADDPYDYEALGWQYETRQGPGGRRVFDTTLPGFSNQGHTYGDALSETERLAVLEYLKTL